MFMRFRGGGVGHKSTREATYCILGDRDALNKVSFTLEHDQLGQGTEESDKDDVPVDDASNEGEGDVPMDDASGSEEEGDQEGPEEVADIGGGEQLVGDELADEMDEYGYTGLDQVLEKSDDEDVEDGEDINNGGDDAAY